MVHDQKNAVRRELENSTKAALAEQMIDMLVDWEQSGNSISRQRFDMALEEMEQRYGHPIATLRRNWPKQEARPAA